MAYHTQIFIVRIEPNEVFAWTASLLIEGMLISLALAKGWVRLWLIPLFIISVLAASASFVVRNEGTLEQFIEGKEAQAQASQTVETLKQDLAETHKAFTLGDRYTTKTLQRERQIRDRLEQVLASGKGQAGHMTLFNSLLFLVLVLVLQGVSVSTAMTLKNGIGQRGESTGMSGTEAGHSTGTEIWNEWNSGMVKPLERGNGEMKPGENLKTEEAEQSEFEKPEQQEPDKSDKPVDESDKKRMATELKKIKEGGQSFEHLAAEFGLSKTTIFRISQYPLQTVSDQAYAKVREALRKRQNGGHRI